MRVLLDCRMASWSGVGRYTVGLTRALAEREDLEVTCAVADADAAELLGAVSDTLVAPASPFSLSGMVELSRAVAHVRPDLTHCLHFPTPLPASGPLVVTLHDLTPLIVDGVMPSPMKRAAYLWLNRRAARVAARILTPSAFTAHDVERILPAAVGKTSVTPEGADDFASGPHEPLPAHLAELAAAPYVFSMGSTRPHKDLPTLLRAFAALAEAHPTLRLLLAGPDVAGYVSASGIAQSAARRVTFTGSLTDGQLRTLYAGSAVFAFPSRYEGFGLPPLEAMALGAPVVCAQAASLPEVVGEAGLMFPPGDAAALAAALETVLTQPSIRHRLVEQGLARATTMTWAATGQRTVSVYRELLRSGRSASYTRHD